MRKYIVGRLSSRRKEEEKTRQKKKEITLKLHLEPVKKT
jgi:hypothetical protein